eukprot:TRINITY_DN9418_c0_g2_i2.p2 TRINITY_DN9418_c0_g2~~TRINITY_DN9418_c0_g2_i2.p2  ORF type:complete len:206 (+),score=51.50 TRINITY_DN9418_c0_g2_i2:700-1317(+)
MRGGTMSSCIPLFPKKNTEGKLLNQYRNEILKRINIQVSQINDYKYELLKAFWTYRGEDEEFEMRVMESQRLCTLISSVMKELATIPSFDKDPFEMSLEEFNPFYEELKECFFADFARVIQEKRIKQKFKSPNLNEVVEEEAEGSAGCISVADDELAGEESEGVQAKNADNEADTNEPPTSIEESLSPNKELGAEVSVENREEIA